MKPELQIALDLTSLELSLQIARSVASSARWIEAGTPLIISQGLKAVEALRAEFPQKTIVADVKIVDAAMLLTSSSIAAGADIITVISAASDQTISICVNLAHQQGKRVLGDHIAAQTDLDALNRLADLGVDYVGIHIPKDSGSTLFLKQLNNILGRLSVPVVLAGGIQIALLEQLRGSPLAAVVVGSAIINSPNPAAEACRFASVLEQWEQ